MQEFVFALEAGGVPIGDIDQEMPLYCVIFRFRSECTQTQVTQVTKPLIERFPPVELFSERKEYISWCNGVPVHVIRKTARLQKLHDVLCGALQDQGAIPVDPDMIGESYRPYVADRGNRCLPAGSSHLSQFVTLYLKKEKFRALIACNHIKLIGR